MDLMAEKVTIQKGTVQETLAFPLYGRSIANQKYPRLFRDTEAAKIMSRMDYDFSKSNMGSIPSIIYGIRHETLVAAAKNYLKDYPDAIIVNLGCGLDTSFTFIDNGKCRYVNLDLPDVIRLRERLFDVRDREMNLAHSALDPAWMDRIGADKSDHVFIISGGVLFYFKPEEVRMLIDGMAKRFHEGGFFFDFENAAMAKISNRMIKKSGNKGAEMYYWVEDAMKEIPAYSDHIRSVTVWNPMVNTYRELPFVARMILNYECKKGMMGFAEVRFI
jgi:O-methyltransferase involved in polyketide biosynthesis